VITEFIEKIREAQPPVIFGDGEQTRDFIFVGDVADCIVRAIEREVSGTFNIGTGNSVSINHLVGLLLKLMNKEHLEPTHVGPRIGDIRHSRAEISKAIKAFGFEPKVTLDGGLRKTINAIE
jgi:UDP-glucose 4-epimerase